MLVLSLDTSSAAVGAAVVELSSQGWVRAESWQEVGGTRHGELLATGVAEVLRRAALAPSDLDALVLGLGPGPFTGLRVGVTSGLVLAHALGLPAYGVCSLDAVGAWDDEPGRRLVVTDARRREVYWAEYTADGERVAGPGVLAPAELAARLAATGWPAPDEAGRVVGEGATRYAEHFAGLDVRSDVLHPDPEALVLVAAHRLLTGEPGDPPEALVPLYLRRPDAEVPAATKRVTAPR